MTPIRCSVSAVIGFAERLPSSFAPCGGQEVGIRLDFQCAAPSKLRQSIGLRASRHGQLRPKMMERSRQAQRVRRRT